ncbi:hypothetical protein [Cohaesibacter gelatinilyticus]|uniref:hypothetical protein n=1 Tax=Cohaesibacter gelatinilyticus TaxID=372072 RepID=UPI001FCE56EC|nr:hypothetical protein [Cohaesibacter gelatinilyticus]
MVEQGLLNLPELKLFETLFLSRLLSGHGKNLQVKNEKTNGVQISNLDFEIKISDRVFFWMRCQTSRSISQKTELREASPSRLVANLLCENLHQVDAVLPSKIGRDFFQTGEV